MNQERTDNSMNGFVSGLLIGGLLGAITALWLAPQSGQKTQQMVRKEANHMKRTANDAVDSFKDNAEHASKDVRQKVAQVQHDGQEWLDHRADQVHETAAKVRNSVA